MGIETRRLVPIGHRPFAVGSWAFVEGSDGVYFVPQIRDEAYGIVQDTLERVAYGRPVGATGA